ncbi:hypothetical protein AC249_AIPGENE14280 [Exaiptasia diaphana]|nr:hypothetical protein AC249_AIPGENE14280 [Exaiptasia diaphana]
MIRDRIVVGLQDGKLAEKLQLDSQLTLEKAVNQARQGEAVKKQQTVVRAQSAAPEVEKPKVNVINRQRRKQNKSKRSNSDKTTVNTDTTCGRCGRSKHPQKSCPAKDATFHRCKKKGHFKEMCRSHKKVDNISDDEESEDEFLGSIAIDELNEDNDWKSQSVYEKTGKQLKKTDTKLTGPGQYNLQVLGMMEAEITASPDNSTKQKVYVVSGLKTPLLGRPAIQALKLLTKVENVNSPHATTFERYSDLFHGLGKLSGEYHIQLKDTAHPYAVHTPRRILAYRTATLEHGYSPSELLMSRHLRTTFPTVPDQLKPSVVDLQRFKEKDETSNLDRKGTSILITEQRNCHHWIQETRFGYQISKLKELYRKKLQQGATM